MLKLIGSILIITVTTWIGFEVAKQLKERPKHLRYLKNALQSLEVEILYGHTPLIEATMRIAKQIPKPLSTMFDSFAHKLQSKQTNVMDAWEESIQEVWRQTSFKQGEYEILTQFGKTLGQHDIVSQQKHIRLALNHLEREEGDAIERQTRYEKMVKSLGFLSGLLIVILLI
ncbi:stage III sporulation protein SpoIIIAB [Bacillus carboniphilus]|uniref:Stage III sporulation protein SpoIIIAB n=1 Tax=Bacillus carboniphilus TaxID=86663 RepID=A0ABY9JZX5_9BACI|nr:stage III sporulation protein SpoIIIAB [Bacillus carboniphilus]WLR43893.1 stage III sporulation protein SpoIIIAB [Bacillus carboniphilus]